MKYEIVKKFNFSAAHRVEGIGSKCEQIHGHNYKVDIVCRGDRNELGVVVPTDKIKEVVGPIIEELDHSALHIKFGFPATAENLAAWIYNRVIDSLPSLHQVRVSETDTFSAAYPV